MKRAASDTDGGDLKRARIEDVQLTVFQDLPVELIQEEIITLMDLDQLYSFANIDRRFKRIIDAYLADRKRFGWEDLFYGLERFVQTDSNGNRMVCETLIKTWPKSSDSFEQAKLESYLHAVIHGKNDMEGLTEIFPITGQADLSFALAQYLELPIVLTASLLNEATIEQTRKLMYSQEYVAYNPDISLEGADISKIVQLLNERGQQAVDQVLVLQDSPLEFFAYYTFQKDSPTFDPKIMKVLTPSSLYSFSSLILSSKNVSIADKMYLLDNNGVYFLDMTSKFFLLLSGGNDPKDSFIHCFGESFFHGIAGDLENLNIEAYRNQASDVLTFVSMLSVALKKPFSIVETISSYPSFILDSRLLQVLALYHSECDSAFDYLLNERGLNVQQFECFVKPTKTIEIPYSSLLILHNKEQEARLLESLIPDDNYLIGFLKYMDSKQDEQVSSILEMTLFLLVSFSRSVLNHFCYVMAIERNIRFDQIVPVHAKNYADLLHALGNLESAELEKRLALRSGAQILYTVRALINGNFESEALGEALSDSIDQIFEFIMKEIPGSTALEAIKKLYQCPLIDIETKVDCFIENTRGMGVEGSLVKVFLQAIADDGKFEQFFYDPERNSEFSPKTCSKIIVAFSEMTPTTRRNCFKPEYFKTDHHWATDKIRMAEMIFLASHHAHPEDMEAVAKELGIDVDTCFEYLLSNIKSRFSSLLYDYGLAEFSAANFYRCLSNKTISQQHWFHQMIVNKRLKEVLQEYDAENGAYEFLPAIERN